jgi:hypothetical protein
MPLAAPAKPARSVLDGAEHGTTLANQGHDIVRFADLENINLKRYARPLPPLGRSLKKGRGFYTEDTGKLVDGVDSGGA